MDTHNTSVKLVSLNAYKVSATYLCQLFFSPSSSLWKWIHSLAAEISFVRAEDINT